MKTAAIRIHAMAKSLGITKARVVGHDIGLMVAYAYAAQYPAEVDRIALLDAFNGPFGFSTYGLVLAGTRRLRICSAARTQVSCDRRQNLNC